jgi:hypothetical protein
MTKVFYFLHLLLLFVFVSSCYSDKYEELYPLNGFVNICDSTSQVTYNKTISVLVNSKCVSCHSHSNPSGNVDLSTYSAVLNATESGALLGSINNAPGYVAMPPNISLQSCEIDRVKEWIQNSTPQ